MRRLVFATLASSLLAIQGCGGGGDDGVAEGPATGSTCPSIQTLNYLNFGNQFFTDFCRRCHGVAATDPLRNTAGVFFDTQQQIRDHSEHIDHLAAAGPLATNTIMPLNDPRPTLEQRQQLGEWIACGAP